MRPSDPIQDAIQQANCEATDATRRRIWQDIAGRPAPSRAAGFARRGICLWRVFMTSKLAMPAVLTVGIVMGVIIGAALPRPQTAYGPTPDSRSQTSTSEPPQPDIFSMRKMAAARDVKGLATILSEGQFASRLVAATGPASMRERISSMVAPLLLWRERMKPRLGIGQQPGAT